MDLHKFKTSSIVQPLWQLLLHEDKATLVECDNEAALSQLLSDEPNFNRLNFIDGYDD